MAGLGKFTEYDIKRLRNLNKKISEIEKLIKKESLQETVRLEKKLKDKENPLTDYEMNFHLSYWINDKNTKYITEQNECAKSTTKDPLIADGKNYDACEFYSRELNKNDIYCYLFHDLEHHKKLKWDQMVDISKILLDVVVTYQKEFILEKERYSLKKFSMKLVEIEWWILNQMEEIKRWINNKLNSQTDFLKDFDLRCNGTFNYAKDSIHYDEESDNIFLALKSIRFNKLNNVTNYNRFQNIDSHPIQKEQHCYLYDCLLEELLHNFFPTFKFIENCGSLWIDIHTIYRQIYDIHK